MFHINVKVQFLTVNSSHTFKVRPDHWHLLRCDDEPVHRAQEGGHPVDRQEPSLGGEEEEGKVGLQLGLHLLGEVVGTVKLVFNKRLKSLQCSLVN